MGKQNDVLGARMKEYEHAERTYLERKVPVIIRIDGKAFHTFTRGMAKPFDDILMTTMQRTMQYLCEHIQGCVFAYTQSDEISLLLTDYATPETDAWFGYNVQKMASVAASEATGAFNEFFIEEVMKHHDTDDDFDGDFYAKKAFKARFDARAANYPKDEVENYFIWRQSDAIRNSVEATGHASFSAREMHGKSVGDVKQMLWDIHGISWDDFPADCKCGSCCYRVPTEVLVEVRDREPVTVTRNKWKIDCDIPLFTQNREFVSKWL